MTDTDFEIVLSDLFDYYGNFIEEPLLQKILYPALGIHPPGEKEDAPAIAQENLENNNGNLNGA